MIRKPDKTKTKNFTIQIKTKRKEKAKKNNNTHKEEAIETDWVQRYRKRNQQTDYALIENVNVIGFYSNETMGWWPRKTNLCSVIVNFSMTNIIEHDLVLFFSQYGDLKRAHTFTFRRMHNLE